MIRLAKFEAAHFEELSREPIAFSLLPLITKEHIALLEKQPFVYSAMKDGKVVACGGLSEYWPGRAEAWALISSDVKSDFFAVTKLTQRVLDGCKIRRIEAAVDVNFKKGHRWIKLLGFKKEADCLEAYLPDGKDCALYARVRH
jgi:hypothetical protein